MPFGAQTLIYGPLGLTYDSPFLEVWLRPEFIISSERPSPINWLATGLCAVIVLTCVRMLLLTMMNDDDVTAAYCEIDMAAYGATIYVNYGYVKINGELVYHSAFGAGGIPYRRGVMVIKVNPYRCSSVEAPREYDTSMVSQDATALSNYLQQLDSGTIIVAVTADEPTWSIAAALSALSEIGADVSDVQYRGTFAFVAQKGFPTKTVIRKILTEGELPENGQMKMSARITGRLPNRRSVQGLLRNRAVQMGFKNL